MQEFAFSYLYFHTESKVKVQEWLLGLRSSDDLFSGAVVPNGVDAFKEYFKDDGANRLLTTHLDNLLGEIESRPAITTPSPSPQPPPPS